MNENNHQITRIAIETLGCKLNQAESEGLSRQLAEAGCSLVQPEEQADIYILNTCTVTHIADRKSRHLLRLARKRNPSALIIAAGCYAQRDPSGLSGLEGVDLVVANSEKAGIPRMLAGLGYIRTQKSSPLPGRLSRTRSFVKIQDGCNNFCSYCIVPFVRGREKSIPPEEVMAEIRLRIADGYREIVLTGTEIGRYDHSGLGLEGLIERILAGTEIQRLRLSSLQPGEISPGLLKLWRDPRLCPHFHISLQSGSATVLQRMGRRYTPAEYAAAVDSLRYEIPGVSITTDMIAGFPGETDEEFRESLRFCTDRQFARIHVFSYSIREGTRAASMPEQVPVEIKKKRSDALLGVARNSLRDFNRLFLEQTRTVLFEQYAAGMWNGFTDNYIKVYSRSNEDLTNRLIEVKLKELRGEGVTGLPCLRKDRP